MLTQFSTRQAKHKAVRHTQELWFPYEDQTRKSVGYNRNNDHSSDVYEHARYTSRRDASVPSIKLTNCHIF